MFANKEIVKLSFIGKGDAAIAIAKYCKDNRINIVSFTGFCPKKEEASYVRMATILNIIIHE